MDDKTFKEALRQWVAGVTIITTAHQGEIRGMTASSFTSVSLDPHLILIAVAETASPYSLIVESGIFAANILHTSQVEWAKRFAGMTPEVTDRFFDIDYATATTGAPILPDIIGWVDCRVHSTHHAGDHAIFVGEVVAAKGIGGKPPLLYYNHSWGQFNVLSE